MYFAQKLPHSYPSWTTLKSTTEFRLCNPFIFIESPIQTQMRCEIKLYPLTFGSHRTISPGRTWMDHPDYVSGSLYLFNRLFQEATAWKGIKKIIFTSYKPTSNTWMISCISHLLFCTDRSDNTFSFRIRWLIRGWRLETASLSGGENPKKWYVCSNHERSIFQWHTEVKKWKHQGNGQ